MNKLFRFFHRAEEGALALLLLMMAFMPVIEFAGRQFFHRGIPGATDYFSHLTLWTAFVGGMLATRDDTHIRIGSILDWLPKRVASMAAFYASFVSVIVAACLAWASFRLVCVEAPSLPGACLDRFPGFLHPLLLDLGLFDDGNITLIGGWLPIWIAELLMPIGFLVMTLRFIWNGSALTAARIGLLLAIPLAVLSAVFLTGYAYDIRWWALGLILSAAVFGAPIFILLGGSAVVLFWGDGINVAAIPVETYRIVISPVFPTIPIFTLVGFILSESKASKRLEEVFQALFGWMPGGAAVATTLVCAFFTTFTGASGVTILALGALLLPVLIKQGFSERFSMGLLTSTGSLGLLLPPSLVIILYAIVARVPVTDMFIAGFMPGTILLIPFCGICIWQGSRSKLVREPFDLKKAVTALRGAAWEVAIPFLVVIFIFSGFCSLVEAAALTAVYALVVETLVYRDLDLKAVRGMLVRCGTLVGGVLIILGVAMGLTSYLVDAQIPMIATDWVSTHIESRWIFLLALNLGLILVGCMMDIFSALFVVVPLILPMAEAFDIHPAHLGVIFLANLQLGYLTPPIGMNLFLASFRFDRPVLTIARYSLPFLLALGLFVLLVTYVPELSLVFLSR